MWEKCAMTFDGLAWSFRAVVILSVGLAVVMGCEDPPPPEPHENTMVQCLDERDNDGDTLIDCADPDCASFCSSDGDADGDSDGDADSDGDGDGDADADGDDADIDDEVELIECTDDEACPASLRCYDYYDDGRLICAPRGASCYEDDDCGPDVECEELPDWAGNGKFCRVGASACSESSACADGYRCEDGACVDRRFSCVQRSDCPWWDTCLPLYGGYRSCVPNAIEHCTEDWECTEMLCVDIDGDGLRECQFSIGSTCQTNADCDDGVCGDEDGERGAECGAVGHCLVTEDCPLGMECVDVNGDGLLECQGTGGDCQLDADCPPRFLCFDSLGSGSPSCVESAE